MQAAAERLPPGYASARPSRTSPSIWRPPLYFSLLLALALLGSVHEVLIRQAAALSSDTTGLAANLGSLLGFAGLIVGTWASRRTCTVPEPCLAPLLTFDALLIPAASSCLFAAFGSSYWWWLFGLVCALCGLSLGATLGLAHAVLAKLWRQLSLTTHLLNPLGLFGFVIGLVIAASVPPVIGFLRSAYVAGLLFALLALWYERLYGYLERRQLHRSRKLRCAAHLAGALSALAFVASEAWVSREQLGFFQHPIVLSARSNRSEVVVTTGPSGFSFFLNGSLRAADVDSHRYFEALVHPAFSVHGRARKVLILGSGDGFVEQEVLRYEAVEQVDVITDDAMLATLARSHQLFQRRTESALDSPKLNLIEAEPIVWLQLNQRRYDVILVDLPDPSEPRWGKNFTRYFYHLLAQHLEPEGVAAIQAGPSFALPRAYSNVDRSIRSAKLKVLRYSVALPSIGEWGFLLASSRRPEVPEHLSIKTRFLSDQTMKAMFVLPKDSFTPLMNNLSESEATPQRSPSTLYDQQIVRLYNDAPHGLPKSSSQ